MYDITQFTLSDMTACRAALGLLKETLASEIPCRLKARDSLYRIEKCPKGVVQGEGSGPGGGGVRPSPGGTSASP